MPKKRKETLSGKTIKAKTECGSFYITLNFQEDELFEVKLVMGKPGSCRQSMLHVVGVLYSIILQSEMDNKDKIKTIRNHCLGVSCGTPFWSDRYKCDMKSCLDFVGKVVLEELK